MSLEEEKNTAETERKAAETPAETRAEAPPPLKGASSASLVGVLTGVCIGAGVALAGGHAATTEAIARARYRFKLASVKKVLPDCENDPGKDTVEVKLPGSKSNTVYRCRRGGRVIAVAYSLDSEANKNPPYSGTIEVLVGVETGKGNIVYSESPRRVGVLILKHSETPGLGAKIEEFDYLRQYGRQNLDKQGRSCAIAARCRAWAVIKDDPAGLVDAISGATISSRAVTEIVKRALTHYNTPAIRAEMTRPSAAEAKAKARPPKGP